MQELNWHVKYIDKIGIIKNVKELVNIINEYIYMEENKTTKKI